jgi:hypothetical protein
MITPSSSNPRNADHGFDFVEALPRQFFDAVDQVDAVVDAKPRENRCRERRQQRQVPRPDRDESQRHSLAREQRDSRHRGPPDRAERDHDDEHDHRHRDEREPRDVALDDLLVVERVRREAGQPCLHSELVEPGRRDHASHAAHERLDARRARVRVGRLNESEVHLSVRRGEVGIDPCLRERRVVEREPRGHPANARSLREQRGHAVDRGDELRLVVTLEDDDEHVRRPELLRDIEERANLGEIGIDEIQIGRAELEPGGDEHEREHHEHGPDQERYARPRRGAASERCEEPGQKSHERRSEVIGHGSKQAEGSAMRLCIAR